MKLKDRTGHIYNRNDYTGVITRVYPQRPWRGKSQRREVIRHRRMVREQNA